MARTTPHFVQITTLGWSRFDALMAWNSTAARLWTRLARSIDGQAVVVSTAVALAADLGVSVATVRRHLAHLESGRALVRFRLPGGLTAFALNPNEVWSGKPAARARAPYCTGVLGGDARGQAALRRGSWFLPGMDLAPPKAKTEARTEPTTGDLFAALEAHTPTPSAPVPTSQGAQDDPAPAACATRSTHDAGERTASETHAMPPVSPTGRGAPTPLPLGTAQDTPGHPPILPPQAGPQAHPPKRPALEGGTARVLFAPMPVSSTRTPTPQGAPELAWAEQG